MQDSVNWQAIIDAQQDDDPPVELKIEDAQVAEIIQTSKSSVKRRPSKVSSTIRTKSSVKDESKSQSNFDEKATCSENNLIGTSGHEEEASDLQDTKRFNPSKAFETQNSQNEVSVNNSEKSFDGLPSLRSIQKAGVALLEKETAKADYIDFSALKFKNVEETATGLKVIKNNKFEVDAQTTKLSELGAQVSKYRELSCLAVRMNEERVSVLEEQNARLTSQLASMASNYKKKVRNKVEKIVADYSKLAQNTINVSKTELEQQQATYLNQLSGARQRESNLKKEIVRLNQSLEKPSLKEESQQSKSETLRKKIEQCHKVALDSYLTRFWTILQTYDDTITLVKLKEALSDDINLHLITGPKHGFKESNTTYDPVRLTNTLH